MTSILGAPTETLERMEELEEISKEVVGIHDPVTRWLFADDILRRLLLRVSLAKSTSAPVRLGWLHQGRLNFALVSTESRERRGWQVVSIAP